jgi:hypothetical protein
MVRRNEMKRALVVYESLFGNARAVAGQVAEGLRDGFDVQVAEVSEAPKAIDDDVALIVVGGPTHQLGMTKPASRRHATAQYAEAPAASDVGLRDWLGALQAPGGASAATFDTRLRRPTILRKLDHANKSEQRALRRHGMRIVVPAEKFLVESATGPLCAGELDRAREWGRRLASLADVR